MSRHAVLSGARVIPMAGERDAQHSAISAQSAGVLGAIERTRFYRLAGAGKSQGEGLPRVPTEAITGLLVARRSLTFQIVSDGVEVRVAVGSTDAAISEGFARSVSATLRGPEPSAIEAAGAMPRLPALGYVVGIPRAAGISRWEGLGPADFLLDALRGKPFALTVFATPAPAEQVQQSLEVVRAEAERLDRDYLALPQQDVHRAARGRRERLEANIARLQQGLRSGLWRVSVIAATESQADTAQLMSNLCGALEEPADRLLLPLRFALVRPQTVDLPSHVNLLRSDELGAFLILPSRDRKGFALREKVFFDLDSPDHAGIRIGNLLDGDVETAQPLEIPSWTLTRHALVTGHTGYGKTSLVHQILREIDREGIPFLVLEPVKSEYRALASAIPDLCVFSVGRVPCEGEIPFQLNPFWFPEQFSLHTHLDLLKNAVTASFGLVPPGPYLLESALLRVYEARGWDLATGRHPNGHEALSFPTLSDLLDQIDAVVDAAGYDLEVSRNLRAALKTRIGNLCVGQKGLALDTRENIPNELLYGVPVVLELKHLGSDAEKAFLMSLVLIRLYEVRDAAGPHPGPEALRHLLVVEEAHRLLRAQRERSLEDGNMAFEAVRTFENLVSEVRAYSQGVLLADQIPSAISPGAIKAMGLKAIHRLGARDDREAVGDSLSEAQRRSLVSLPIGHAAIHAEGMSGPVKVAVTRPPRLEPVAESELARRVARQLSPTARRSLEAASIRVRFGKHLRAPAVVREADAVLLAVTADVPVEEPLRALSRALTRSLIRVDGARHGSEQEDGRAQLLQALALQDALTRRAVHYGWSSSDVDRVRKQLGGVRGDSDDTLGSLLHRSAGPHEWCGACPQPCRFGYEGALLARDDRFLADVAEVRERPSCEWDELLGTAAAAVMCEQFGTAIADGVDGLGGCATAHALTRLGVRESAVGQLIAPLFAGPQKDEEEIGDE